MRGCNCSSNVHLWCSSLVLTLLVIFVCAQGLTAPNPDGFINIDCGLDSDSSYNDSFTGLTYVSDDQYIDTGVNSKISTQYQVYELMYKDLETLRSFPDGTKNCYTLSPVSEGSKYLVRATFYYGNYDNLGAPPSFDLYFGVNFWCTVVISASDYWYAPEIIAVSPENYIQVCLVNTGHGTPFISALELRPLSSTLYELATSMQSLALYGRKDVGWNGTVVRYPVDAHDRLWLNYTQSSWATISTNSSIGGSIFEVPSLVFQTAAVTTAVNDTMDISWLATDQSKKFLVVIYYSEIQILPNNSLREFDIYSNGVKVQFPNGPIRPEYDSGGYAYFTTTAGCTDCDVSLKSTPSATVPPILNAFELYTVLPVQSWPTYNGDVTAINSIKENYRVSKGWSGDPCVPTNLGWFGVNCTADSSNITRITALNLSSSQLTGATISAFGNLTALLKLDLSRNSLSGNIPSSWDQLTALTFLDISGNHALNGKLPPVLQKRQQDGSLTLNSNGTTAGPAPKKSSKAIIIIIVAVVIVMLIVGASTLFFLYRKKHNSNTPNTGIDPHTSENFGEDGQGHVSEYQDSVRAEGKRLTFEKMRFSFAELKLITNDLSDQIGIGGFGKVYQGCLQNGKQVAVKVRSESSTQGVKQFLNEVENLSRVHHKNLVTLIGYCNDGNHIALVYEHMQGGNLQDWLRGNALPLPWKERVRIAHESAQGLEYLHKMCNPPLIHRDVKTSNILLTTNLEAKISDFGLVRAFNSTHVTTQVVGTPGYLDPFYASSSQLTEKSDVYSFGVVLLEIVTGRSPILHGPRSGQHLAQFVQQRLTKGNIESILDQNMGGRYNINSIWKVTELALRCTDQPKNRPDMTAVVTELKESLELEISSTEPSSMVSGDISQVSDYSRNENLGGDVIYGGNIEMAIAGGMRISDQGPLAR